MHISNGRQNQTMDCRENEKDYSDKTMNEMRADYLFYKRAYEDNSQNPLWQYMHEYFADRYSAEAMKILDTDRFDTPRFYTVSVYTATDVWE